MSVEITKSENVGRGKLALQTLSQDLRAQAFAQAYEATLPSTIRSHMPLDRAANILMRACQKNPTLLQCTPQSLKQCLLDSAALGLELAGPLHHTHAVPYFDSKAGGQVAQLQIGFQGLLELARRTGAIDGAPVTNWVYENDTYTLNIADGKNPITHSPCVRGDRGEPLFVYCLARFVAGGVHFRMMTKSDVEKHRDKFASRGGKISKVWSDHFTAMGEKTILKMAAKFWPMSSEFASAIEADDAADRGERVTLAVVDNLAEEAPPTEETTKGDELAKRLKGKRNDWADRQAAEILGKSEEKPAKEKPYTEESADREPGQEG